MRGRFDSGSLLESFYPISMAKRTTHKQPDELPKRLIEMSVADAVTEKPLSFTVAGVGYTVKPPTLAKMQILSKYFLLLEIDDRQFGENPMTEAMRLCVEKTDAVCLLMAVATMETRDELLNDAAIAERAELFKWNANLEHFSTVILAVIAQTRYENFMTSIRLTKTFRINEPKATGTPDRVE